MTRQDGGRRAGEGKGRPTAPDGRPVAGPAPIHAANIDETLETLRRARGLAALAAIRQSSRERGLDRLSMKDIDAVIARVRGERRSPGPPPRGTRARST